MKATIIGMLICVVAAAVVMVAVALPRLRGGARVLTPSGREQVTDARRRAVALAAQAKGRAALVAEQAKDRAAGAPQAKQPQPGQGQASEADPGTGEPSRPDREPVTTSSRGAALTRARAAQGSATLSAPALVPVATPVASPAGREVVDVRRAEGASSSRTARPSPTTRPSLTTRPSPTTRPVNGETRRVAGVIPGVSPRAAHRMRTWDPTSTGPRHAR